MFLELEVFFIEVFFVGGFFWKIRSRVRLWFVFWVFELCFWDRGIDWRIVVIFCFKKGWENGVFGESIGNFMRIEIFCIFRIVFGIEDIWFGFYIYFDRFCFRCWGFYIVFVFERFIVWWGYRWIYREECLVVIV